MWPYFYIPLKGHIRQVLLYLGQILIHLYNLYMYFRKQK
jgi:hypothetical protein